MLNPNQTRSKFRTDKDSLLISIPAKRQIFVLVFLSFWLVGWAVGWLETAGALLGGGHGAGGLFMLAWLGAWTVGGAAAISHWLWLAAGVETIHVTPDRIEVARTIPGWQRKVVCDTTHVDRLRVSDTPPVWGANRSFASGIWAAKSAGRLCFDYGAHTIGFGLELDDGEARQILRRITEDFPTLAQTQG